MSQTRTRPEGKMVVVPGSSKTHEIARVLKSAGIRVMERTGSKISELIKGNKIGKSDSSIVYKVPCGGCTKAYVGETYRGLKTRISEHKRDVRNHKTASSFVIHIEEEQHLPEWNRAEIMWSGREKSRRKIMESAAIETVPNINCKRGIIH